jgi:hypothetical protein
VRCGHSLRRLLLFEQGIALHGVLGLWLGMSLRFYRYLENALYLFTCANVDERSMNPRNLPIQGLNIHTTMNHLGPHTPSFGYLPQHADATTSPFDVTPDPPSRQLQLRRFAERLPNLGKTAIWSRICGELSSLGHNLAARESPPTLLLKYLPYTGFLVVTSELKNTLL